MTEEIIGFQEGQEDITDIDQKLVQVRTIPEPSIRTFTIADKKQIVEDAKQQLAAAKEDLQKTLEALGIE